MNRRELLTGAGAALAGLTFPLSKLPAFAGRRKKVLYFTRCAGFEHSVVKRAGTNLAFSEKLLTELGQKAGFDVECTKDGRVFDESLDKYDLLAFYTSGDLTQPDKYNTPPMTKAGKQRLLDAVAAGKGYAGFHSANDSFHSAGPRDENQQIVDPYLAMVGGEFIVHGRQQEATLKVTSPKFPGMEGLGDSLRLLEEWYAMKNFARDLHVTLLQDTAGMVDACYQRPPFPATWVRKHHQGRVFYTSFGHREDILTNPKVQKIILGGFAWAMREVDADVTPNIAQVAPGAGTVPKLPPPKPKK
jgi:type 1 glutamine amidotransferase